MQLGVLLDNSKPESRSKFATTVVDHAQGRYRHICAVLNWSWALSSQGHTSVFKISYNCNWWVSLDAPPSLWHLHTLPEGPTLGALVNGRHLCYLACIFPKDHNQKCTSSKTFRESLEYVAHSDHECGDFLSNLIPAPSRFRELLHLEADSV